MSTLEPNARELVSRFYEAFDAGDIDVVLSVVSEDLETTDPGMGTVHGRGPFREYIETLKRAVPDARAVIDDMYDAGDVVVVEGRATGRTKTGRVLDAPAAWVWTVRDGVVVANHNYHDTDAWRLALE
jgi:uncharacterized protein